jgi:hypothetical protein
MPADDSLSMDTSVALIIAKTLSPSPNTGGDRLLNLFARI